MSEEEDKAALLEILEKIRERQKKIASVLSEEPIFRKAEYITMDEEQEQEEEE